MTVYNGRVSSIRVNLINLTYDRATAIVRSHLTHEGLEKMNFQVISIIEDGKGNTIITMQRYK